MKPRQIVIGQYITENKKLRSRAMRREMTSAEALLWARLRSRQIAEAKFRRQQIIAGFIADFYCHEAALVIELDGDTHEPQHDAERDAVFVGMGITSLRFPNTEVEQNIEAVLSHIRWFLEASQLPSSTEGPKK